MNVKQAPPDGFRENRSGHFVPVAQIKPIDLLRDGLVMEKVTHALQLRQRLRDFKQQLFPDIDAFVQVSAEQYNARIGGGKGNVALFSFDGRYKMVRAIQDAITFDERLQAAKALIDECLNDWTEGADPKLRTLVNKAFRVDSDGNIKTGEVLSLRQLEFDDPRWQQAMVAISDAVTVVSSKTYVRFYERDANGMYQPISLDLAVL